MSKMSRKSTREYTLKIRERYAEAGRGGRMALLREYRANTGFSRSYADKLLTGKREYRDAPARGKVYDGETAVVLERIWRESGCMNTKYLAASMRDWVEDFETHVAVIPPAVRVNLLRMSASSMDRLLKGKPREDWAGRLSNRRSGRNGGGLKESVTCRSGETVMACDVAPGDVQVDTFALGGGDPSENFYWILMGSDRKTQWSGLAPAWNRGEKTTMDALRTIAGGFPFAITSLHSDNGGEFINHHLLRELPRLLPDCVLSRSRPRRCNDNAHVEQKNGAIGRRVFGEMRVDCPEAGKVLERLCATVALYVNLYRPCKMLVSKTKRENGKGFACRYDEPATPLERVLASGVVSEKEAARLLSLKKKYSGIELLGKIKRLVRKVRRIQAKASSARRRPTPTALLSAQGSALRAAPPGPPFTPSRAVERGMTKARNNVRDVSSI